MQRWSTNAQAGRGWRSQIRTFMKDKVYKLIELTGTSTKSIEEAVNNALKRAGKTIQNLSWFQIVETRGSIEKNQVKHWQVTIKVGFMVE